MKYDYSTHAGVVDGLMIRKNGRIKKEAENKSVEEESSTLLRMCVHKKNMFKLWKSENIRKRSKAD